MADRLPDDKLAEIRADLASVPAPPWQWTGHRTTGPILTTTHSGWRYILGPARPVDERGDQAEDSDGTPIYGDLEFRDEGGPDESAVMRRAADMAIPRAVYDPDSIRGIDNAVARWIQRSAEHATALLAEVDRLTTALAKAEAQRDPHLADIPGAETLNTRQRAVLAFLRAHVELRGYPPSCREICDAVGVTSTSTVAHHLRALQRKGFLRRDPGRPRALELTHPDRAAGGIDGEPQ